MKILYISSVDVSLTKGPSANEREFIPALYRLKGEKSHFLIPKPCNTLPKDIPVSACTFTKPHKERKPLDWIFHQVSVVRKTKKILSENSFDLIVIRADVFPFCYRYVTNKHGIPFAMKTAGSGEFKVFRRKNLLLKALKGLNQLFYNSLVSNAIYVDVVSPMQRNSLREITGAGEKIQWIDNGVNIDRFKPADKKESKKKLQLEKFDPIIGYAGNLPWKRGGMQIVQALPELSKKYPNIGGVILGSGEGMQSLYDEARSLGVYERCVFTGQVDYNLVVDYINCMDVGISQLNYDEQGASEQKVRQYLACGKPVIVSPGEVNQFISDKNLGYIVSHDDINGFLKAIKSILDLSENEYDLISKRSREYAENNLSFRSKVLERIEAWEKVLNR